MTIILRHFLRGEMEVTPIYVDGKREWFCPNRPMLRPMEDGDFLEKRTDIETLLQGVVVNGN